MQWYQEALSRWNRLLNTYDTIQRDAIDMSSSRRHVLAWYTYAAASEVFSAIAMGMFLPITLERMAREVGYAWPELAVPCDDTQGGVVPDENAVCKAWILWGWVDTASFSMYVKSVAVAVQAISIISVGPLANSPFWRKRLLILFAYTGAFSAIAFFVLPSTRHGWIPVMAALLTIIGNVGFGTSVVCANAFLPLLAKEAVQEQSAKSLLNGDTLEDSRESETLLPRTVEETVLSTSTADIAAFDPGVPDSAVKPSSALSLATSRISSIAIATGCFTTFFVLGILAIPISLGGGSVSSLQVAIGICGAWWAVFTVPCWIGLPGKTDQTGSDTRSGLNDGSPKERWWSPAKAWGQVIDMVRWKEIKQLPNLYKLLLAWIFLADGFHTTTYTAILYASSTLHLPPSRIIVIGLLVQIGAVLSSPLSPRLQRRMGYSNLRFLSLSVLLAQILPLYACLGLILPFGGLRTAGEMYVAALWFGMLYGPFNSYSRAVYAELIPPGHESSFFSLFSLTDKSASFIGPFIVGLIADRTGNIRLGFLFLAVMLAVPIPILSRVKVEEGVVQARQWSEAHEGPQRTLRS